MKVWFENQCRRRACSYVSPPGSPGAKYLECMPSVWRAPERGNALCSHPIQQEGYDQSQCRATESVVHAYLAGGRLVQQVDDHLPELPRKAMNNYVQSLKEHLSP